MRVAQWPKNADSGSGGGPTSSPVWTQFTGDRTADVVQSGVSGAPGWVLSGTGPYTWTLQGTASTAEDGTNDVAHIPIVITDIIPDGFDFETHDLLVRMTLTSHFRDTSGSPHIGPSVSVVSSTGSGLGEALTNGSATLHNSYNMTTSSAAARDTLTRGAATGRPSMIVKFGWYYDESRQLYCIPGGQGANEISKRFNTLFVGGGGNDDTDAWTLKLAAFLVGGGTALNDTFTADYEYSWAERPAR